jgi:hypothetical protein
MTLPGYNHKFGQQIMTDAEGVDIDRAFLAHYHIDAEDAPAASSDGVHAAMNLGAAVQAITTGITNPGVPRNIRIDGNVSGITGNVKITGTNFDGKVITEEITANGTTAVDGNLAFKTVTKIDLPVQNHTPTKQKGTVAVTAGASAAGTVVLTVTGAAIPGETHTRDVNVAVTTDDNTTAEVATKIAAALNADEVVGAHYTAAAATANVTLEAKVPAAQDSTLDIAVEDADNTSVTLDTFNKTTVQGVPYDQISVGWGDKFGIPYMLYADELVILKLFGKAADSGTVTNDADELEKNVFDPNGTPDGLNDIDLYIVV